MPHPLRTSRRLFPALASILALAAAVLAPAGPAAADGTGSLSLAGATTVGIHNTYDKSAYTYLAQGLDAGASLIELDTWVNVVTHKWNVSHANPLGSDNNCVQASTAADLYTGNRDQNLDSCLDDIRIWLAAHPGHGPVMVKLEMKAGFDASGFSPRARAVISAMKTYGLVLADNGSPWFFTGERNRNWPPALVEELKRIPASAFEAVDTSALR